MSCKQNHEQLTTKFCSDCGAKRIEQQQLTEDDIAKQLNEIVKEVIKETKADAFYRNGRGHMTLFLEKILKRKLEIPNGMVFVITVNSPNHIITLKELYEAYPCLKEVDIQKNIKNMPTLEEIEEKVQESEYFDVNCEFIKLCSFMVVNGEYKNGKFSNRIFDKIVKTLTDDKEFKESGLPLSVLLDDSYYSIQRNVNNIKNHIIGLKIPNKNLVKFIVNQVNKEFA